MSTIYKCDRCGRDMNKIHNRLKEVYIEGKVHVIGGGELEMLDLCEECYKDFKSFMFGPERDLDSKTTLRPWSEVGPPPKINGYPLLSNDDSDSDVVENHPMIYGCKQCEFEYTSINDEPCFSCGYGKSNFKPKDTKDTGRVYSIGSYVVNKSNRSRVCKITDIVKNDQGDVCYKLVSLDSKQTENTVTKNYLDSFYDIFYDPLAANDDSDSDVIACEQCKFKDFSWDEEPCSTCKYSVMNVGDDPSDNFESKEEEGTSNLSKAKYKVGSYLRSDDGKGYIYKIVGIRLRDDGEFIYSVINLSTNSYCTKAESTIDNWYAVIVKYSCEGCKLEGTDDVMCDTCIVGDPKGPRRQWWKPKEEGE